MPELTGPNSPAVGFLLALTIGFLVGRTREPGPHDTPRPGMRDFLIIALLGAVAGHLGNAAIAIALFAGTIGAILVMRAQHPERNGITTELAAVATFVLGALCLTSDRPFGAGLGIVLAAILAERDQLRSFVRDAISDREFIDTLSFLALIFIIYPLLPAGSYGPFGFFDPRRIWLFVILVSGVSYVGYFLTKFTGSERGALLTAIVGAIASTTAYTTGISQAVADGAGVRGTGRPLCDNIQFDTLSPDVAAGGAGQSDARDRGQPVFRRDDAGGVRRRADHSRQ